MCLLCACLLCADGVVAIVAWAVNLNLANAYLKLHEPRKALEAAERALLLDPASNKALFRRGQARLRIPPIDVDVARADLMAACKRDPQNRDIRNELERLKQVHATQKREEREKYGGIFEKAAAKEPPPPPPKPQRQLEGFATHAFGRRGQ